MKTELGVSVAALAALMSFGAMGDADADKEFPTMFLFPVLSARENVYGPQLSLWTVNENLYGAQVSPILGLSDKMNGVQIALGGNLASHVRGLQIGLVNDALESLYGLQVGIVNMVCKYRSCPNGVFVQLGLLNFTCNEYKGDGDNIGLLPLLRVGW